MTGSRASGSRYGTARAPLRWATAATCHARCGKAQVSDGPCRRLCSLICSTMVFRPRVCNRVAKEPMGPLAPSGPSFPVLARGYAGGAEV